MNLDEGQRKKVAEWVEQGLKLSQIQSRLASELGLTLTYMDVRLLVDDLRLTPKDPERPSVPVSPLAAPGAGIPAVPGVAVPDEPESQGEAEESGKAGGVSITVDQLARPGAVVSGKVRFSDGNTASWYFDQTGRLGLSPQQAGYRPPASDLQQFQMALENELSKLGY